MLCLDFSGLQLLRLAESEELLGNAAFILEIDIFLHVGLGLCGIPRFVWGTLQSRSFNTWRGDISTCVSELFIKRTRK